MCRCGNENGILVAYGVDSEGEWETLECAECGKVWLERKEHGMKVNGYEIGKEPTGEEMAIYRKVHEFILRETTAQWLGGREHDGSLTDDEFETLCSRFIKADFSAEEWDFLKWEYDEIIGERS